MTQRTLPDFVAPGLRALSVGLNPSLPSVEAGYYFANPRNRFWRALNASRLLPRALTPGRAAHRTLLDEHGIGFTDVVKRATAGAKDLRAADFRLGAPRLREQIERLRPALVWFHGKVAYGQFLRHGGYAHDAGEWGLQPEGLAASRVFVTPNPSPANAAYSLEVLTGWYDELSTLI